MSANLYKLPKDILVKLVSEIQDMTEKKYEDLKLLKKYIDLCDSEIEIHRCNFKKCQNYITEGHIGTEGNCEYIKKCIICSLEFCCDHLNYYDVCSSCSSDPIAKLLESGYEKQIDLDKGCGKIYTFDTCDTSFCCFICESVKCDCERIFVKYSYYICRSCEKVPKIRELMKNIDRKGVSL